MLITKSQIISAVAYWGVFQSPFVAPKNLTEALNALSVRIDEKKIFRSTNKINLNLDCFLEIEQEGLRYLLSDLIFNTPEISIWNVTQQEQDQGITHYKEEKRTVQHQFVSRDFNAIPEDEGFIDLDALFMNVVNMLVVSEE